jgi:hypothetical protein
MNPNLNRFSSSPSSPSPRSSTSVRLYCRLVRTFSAPGRPARHAESCADCRRYFQASDQLDAALRRDAIRFAPPAPAGLERGIMQAIHAAMPPTEVARPRTPARSASPRAGWWAGISVAVAAAIALAVGLVQPPASKPANPNLPSGVTVADSAAPSAVEAAGERWWNVLVPPAEKIATAAPLQDELEAVYSDTRSALDFLALNFLPSSALRPQPTASGIGRG